MASGKRSSAVDVEKEEKEAKKGKKDEEEAFEDRQDLISRYASSVNKDVDCEDVVQAVDEYYKAMKVKKHLKDFDATKASFGGPIDDIWRLHILNTSSYQSICGSRLINHDPNGGKVSCVRYKRYALFLDTYKKLYGIEAPTRFFTPLPPIQEIDDDENEPEIKVEDKKEENDPQSFSIKIQSVMVERFEIKILPATSIKRVKEIIEKKKGYESNHQRLIFAGKELTNIQTSTSLGLEQGHTLSLCLNALDNVEKYNPSCNTILFRPMSNALLSLAVLPSTNALRMKELVEREFGIPANQQKLLFAGRNLSDSDTFASSSMYRECIIDIVLGLQGC
jgi:hypothetical protein